MAPQALHLPSALADPSEDPTAFAWLLRKKEFSTQLERTAWEAEEWSEHMYNHVYIFI